MEQIMKKHTKSLDKLWKNTLSNSMSRKSPHEEKATEWI